MRPRSVRLLIPGASLLGYPDVFAVQEVRPKVASTAAASVDPRYRRGARRYRRFQTRITVPCETPPERLTEFRDGILDLIRDRPGLRQEKYEVVLNDLGSPGVEIPVRVFFHVSDGHAELTARDGLILEIVRAADRLGVAFAEPGLAAPK